MNAPGNKRGNRIDPDQSLPFSHWLLPVFFPVFSILLDRFTIKNHQRTMQDPWLSVDQIAAHLGVRSDTVYKWISRNAMPAHKAGRLWKFKAAEVDAWIRSGDAADRQRHVGGAAWENRETQP